MMDGYDMNGWGWAGMTLMAVVIVAILCLIAWVIARRPHLPEQSARAQLDARLASGAIDTQEYRERLEALDGQDAA